MKYIVSLGAEYTSIPIDIMSNISATLHISHQKCMMSLECGPK